MSKNSALTILHRFFAHDAPPFLRKVQQKSQKCRTYLILCATPYTIFILDKQTVSKRNPHAPVAQKIADQR